MLKNLIFLLLTNTLVGQGNDILIKSPNNYFNSIELQTYKGLPRLGILDYTNLKSQNQIRNYKYSVNINYYFLLLEMKYLADHYYALDNDRPTTSNSSIKSRSIENHLRKLVSLMGTREVKEKYLWGWGNYRFNKWKGETEIERTDSYRNFMKDVYPGIRGWSDDLWNNNEAYCYLVSQTTLGAYNSQNQGYIIPVKQEKINDGNYVYNSKYAFRPLENYEKSLSKDNKYFFEYPEDKASLLENKILNKSTVYGRGQKHVYLVQKIRLYRGNNMFDDRNLGPQIEFLYNITSPVLEIFEDMALSSKIGELNLDEF